MKIEIIGSPVAEISVDLHKFKRLMQEEFNLEHSVKGSTTVVSSKLEKVNPVDAMFLEVDWGKVIDKMNIDDQPIMNIRMFGVRVDSWNRYYPGRISQDYRTFEIREEVEKDIIGTILLTDFIMHPSTLIKMFIDGMQFNYGTKDDKSKWGMDININGEKHD